MGEIALSGEGCASEQHPMPSDLMAEITPDELRAAIARMGTGKAAGPDGVSAEMLQQLPDEAVEYLRGQFNAMLRARDVPDGWRVVHVYPILKKKDHAGDPQNYRPISLMCVPFKLLQATLAARLQRFCAECAVFGGEQYGFLRGRHIEDPISDVLAVLADARARGREAHLLAIDIAKAYDTVSPAHMHAAMQRAGLPLDFQQYVRNIYRRRRARIITGFGLTSEYPVQRGISQDDPLSCLLFVLWMEVVLQAGRQTGAGYRLADGRLVTERAFADDLMLVSETRAGLEGLFAVVAEQIERAGMRLNIAKCEYMTTSANKAPLGIAGRPEHVRCLKRGEALRYLGVWVDEALEMTHNSEAAAEKVLGRVGLVARRRGLPLALGVQLLNECCTSCIQFTARNAPMRADELARVESAYGRCVRALMGRRAPGDARDVLFLGEEDGGLGVRSPTDVHDETVLLQLVQRCALGAAETALGRNVRLEAALWGGVPRVGWLAQALAVLVRRELRLIEGAAQGSSACDAARASGAVAAACASDGIKEECPVVGAAEERDGIQSVLAEVPDALGECTNPGMPQPVPVKERAASLASLHVFSPLILREYPSPAVCMSECGPAHREPVMRSAGAPSTAMSVTDPPVPIKSAEEVPMCASPPRVEHLVAVVVEAVEEATGDASPPMKSPACPAPVRMAGRSCKRRAAAEAARRVLRVEDDDTTTEEDHPVQAVACRAVRKASRKHTLADDDDEYKEGENDEPGGRKKRRVSLKVACKHARGKERGDAERNVRCRVVPWVAPPLAGDDGAHPPAYASQRQQQAYWDGIACMREQPPCITAPAIRARAPSKLPARPPGPFRCTPIAAQFHQAKALLARGCPVALAPDPRCTELQCGQSNGDQSLIRQVWRRQRLLALRGKRTTILLDWNIISGIARVNKAHFVRRTSLRQYVMLMQRAYMAQDSVCRFLHRGNGRCPLCGRPDSFRHYICGCPHSTELERELFGQLHLAGVPREPVLPALPAEWTAKLSAAVNARGAALPASTLERLFLRSQDTLKELDEVRFLARFGEEAARLAGVGQASPARVLPFSVSAQLLHAGWLRTVLYAHPACADAGAEDIECEGAFGAFFGATHDGGSLARIADDAEDTLVLAVLNVMCVDCGVVAAAMGRRLLRPRPCRFVIVVPSDASAPFVALHGHGGVEVMAWLVARAGCMAWWPGDFWCKEGTPAVVRGDESEGTVSFLCVDNTAAREHYPVRRRHVKRAMAALGGRAVVERGAPWLPAYLAGGVAAEEAEGPDLDEMYSFFADASARLRARVASEPLRNVSRYADVAVRLGVWEDETEQQAGAHAGMTRLTMVRLAVMRLRGGRGTKHVRRKPRATTKRMAVATFALRARARAKLQAKARAARVSNAVTEAKQTTATEQQTTVESLRKRTRTVGTPALRRPPAFSFPTSLPSLPPHPSPPSLPACTPPPPAPPRARLMSLRASPPPPLPLHKGKRTHARPPQSNHESAHAPHTAASPRPAQTPDIPGAAAGRPVPPTPSTLNGS